MKIYLSYLESPDAGRRVLYFVEPHVRHHTHKFRDDQILVRGKEVGRAGESEEVRLRGVGMILGRQIGSR